MSDRSSNPMPRPSPEAARRPQTGTHFATRLAGQGARWDERKYVSEIPPLDGSRRNRGTDRHGTGRAGKQGLAGGQSRRRTWTFRIHRGHSWNRPRTLLGSTQRSSDPLSRRSRLASRRRVSKRSVALGLSTAWIESGECGALRTTACPPLMWIRIRFAAALDAFAGIHGLIRNIKQRFRSRGVVRIQG